MNSPPKILPKPEDKVLYDHQTGNPLVYDPNTNSVTPLKGNFQGKWVDQLKGPTGRYRTEIRSECKRLYLNDVKISEIHERTRVPIRQLHTWIYKAPGWRKQKEQALQEMRDKNADAYVMVERQVIEKIENFLSSRASRIKNPNDMRIYAETLSKLLNPASAKSQKQIQGNTQINIAVTPLSQEEARKVIANDPAKLIDVTDNYTREGNSDGTDLK